MPSVSCDPMLPVKDGRYSSCLQIPKNSDTGCQGKVELG